MNKTLIESKLTDIGVKSNNEWHPDIVHAISSDFLLEWEQSEEFFQLELNDSNFAHNKVYFFVNSFDKLKVSEVSNICLKLLKIFPSDNRIIIVETGQPHGEQCFQFEHGTSIVFLTQKTLQPPYSVFVHEFVHATGLTGIPEIDEGLATLFENAFHNNEIELTESIRFNQKWLNKISKDTGYSRHPNYFGRTYFSIFCNTKGEHMLWKERNRLASMGNGKCTVEMERVIEDYLIKNGLDKQSEPEQIVNSDVPMEKLYFSADQEDFKHFLHRAESLFSTNDVSELNEADQLNFARYLGLLSVKDDEKFISNISRVRSETDYNERLSPNAVILLDVANKFFEIRGSKSRIDMENKAKKIHDILVENLNNYKIKADILYNLIMYHKHMPFFIGEGKEKALEYIGLMSRVEGMDSLCNKLRSEL